MQNTNTEELALYSIATSVDGYKNKDIPKDKNRLHVDAQWSILNHKELFRYVVDFRNNGQYKDESGKEIKADGCMFLRGVGHPGFQAVMKGVNMILVNDSNKHNHGHLDFSLKKEFEDGSLLTPGEQEAMKSRPIVLLGTQLTSGEGSCFSGTYLTERFFTKNNGEMMKSLDNYIKNVSSEYSYKYDPTKLQIGAWRKEGKFVAQVAYPKWNDDGTETWDKPVAIDLIGWKYAVDYVKDTQSRTFINNFITRYKKIYDHEPTIGKLKLPLSDYVDFFSTTVDNGKLQTNAASAMAAISLKRRGFGTADVDEFYDKNFNFNELLSKIIKTNNLKITVEQLNKILEDKHQAKDNPDKMFVLAQDSEELLKSIQEVQSKDNKTYVKQIPQVTKYKRYQPNYPIPMQNLTLTKNNPYTANYYYPGKTKRFQPRCYTNTIQTSTLTNYNPYTANYYYPGTKKTKINYKKPHEISGDKSGQLFIGGCNYDNLPTWNACSLKNDLIRGNIDHNDRKYIDWIMYDINNQMPGYQMTSTYPNNYYTYN